MPVDNSSVACDHVLHGSAANAETTNYKQIVGQRCDRADSKQKRNSAVYYSLSPDTFSQAHDTDDEMTSSNRASSGLGSEKLEYFAISSNKEKNHISRPASSCDVEMDCEDKSSLQTSGSDQVFVIKRSLSEISAEDPFQDCNLSPDEDFMRDGYCRCSFCNHDDLPISSLAASREQSPNNLIISAVETESQKLITLADVVECNPPWMKERKRQDLSKTYRESLFHRTAVKLFHQCEIETLQEAQVLTV